MIGSFDFDVHTLLYASLAILCGYQAVLFAIFTKTCCATWSGVTSGAPPGYRPPAHRARWKERSGNAARSAACCSGMSRA
jgi:hypothetical protein